MTEFEVEACWRRWTVDAEIARNLAFLVKEALYKYQYPKTAFASWGFRRSGYIGRRRVCGHSRLWRGRTCRQLLPMVSYFMRNTEA